MWQRQWSQQMLLKQFDKVVQPYRFARGVCPGSLVLLADRLAGGLFEVLSGRLAGARWVVVLLDRLVGA